MLYDIFISNEENAQLKKESKSNNLSQSFSFIERKQSSGKGEPMDHKDFNLLYSIFMDDLKP